MPEADRGSPSAPRPLGPPDVAGRCLDLLDVDVGVEHDPERVVGRVAFHDASVAPVIRQADLLHIASFDLDLLHPLGDVDSRANRAARGDDVRPTPLLQVTLAGQARAHLAKELWLQLAQN